MFLNHIYKHIQHKNTHTHIENFDRKNYPYMYSFLRERKLNIFVRKRKQISNPLSTTKTKKKKKRSGSSLHSSFFWIQDLHRNQYIVWIATRTTTTPEYFRFQDTKLPLHNFIFIHYCTCMQGLLINVIMLLAKYTEQGI